MIVVLSLQFMVLPDHFPINLHELDLLRSQGHRDGITRGAGSGPLIALRSRVRIKVLVKHGRACKMLPDRRGIVTRGLPGRS
jgi:hypothetical protein